MKSIHLEKRSDVDKQPITLDSESYLYRVTGANGSGKTDFLKEIAHTYKKTHKVKSLLTSVLHFASYPEIKKYKKLAKIKNLDFKDEYDIITQLADNQSLIENCNALFEKFDSQLKLHLPNAESGWLLFKHSKFQYTFPFDRISPSEKSIFVLWLLLQNASKYDILLIDNFDIYFDSKNKALFYKLINETFAKNKVHVFIASPLV
jgi:Cdc6-like AAA superfamily ATPase